MNRSALLRKAARIFTKSDAPQGALLFQPMATPWENRPQERIRPERAPSPARSIRKRGFLMGRPSGLFDGKFVEGMAPASAFTGGQCAGNERMDVGMKIEGFARGVEL
jgi:hypothetical protein